MSRGPGTRQRALLAAVQAGEVVWVVPPNASHSEAAAWRRAARALALNGGVRAIYLRRLDRRGRALAHLAVTHVDSTMQGDAYPLRSPAWVEPPPLFLTTFSACVQAVVLEHVTGLPCSPRTAARAARQWWDREVA